MHYSVASCSRPEIAGDVILGVAVDSVGMDSHVKLGDSRSNRSLSAAHFVIDEDGN